MIGKLKGIVDSVNADGAVIDVQGVGYVVFCSSKTLQMMGEAGSAATLLIDTHVREDHIHLYGFVKEEERQWFRLLTTVQGVGARMGIAILSALSPSELAMAIAAQDKATLTRANGVGPKLAIRLLTELKDKAPMVMAQAPVPAPLSGKKSAAKAPAEAAYEDALSALVHLGYSRVDAFQAISRIRTTSEGELELAKIIPMALKELSA